jgi:hypothetical protein
MAEKKSLVSEIFSEKNVVGIVVLGILLIWVYALLTQFNIGADLTRVVKALKQTGMTLVSIMLIGGGMANTNIEKNVRATMVVMGTVMLVVQVLGWTYVYY